MNIVEIVGWVKDNWLAVIDVYLKVVGAASAIVILTPTLKDDNALKAIIKFIGKYVALNTDKGSSPKP